ncbi:hypothetical protein NDU88_002654 [Pleurodeles waltl]|uniref:Uncharacterized protein n=1 Tax=Pleurodeles waltl TaxID=8319 RepID=A0AAV7SB39_PLEWA|nr:hypothetical protein NDU88_002654 [Pleurodeles waltl]
MLERIDMHVERLDMVERHFSDVNDEQATSAGTQQQKEKTILVLQAKAEDFEGPSQQNNLQIDGLAESTDVSNMESFVELLLIELLGHETFSDIFVEVWAHRSLAPHLVPGACPHPILE